MTQATIRKLVVDSVTVALEARVATMANTSNPNRNTGPTGTPNAYAQPMGVDQANKITLTELKRLLINKYCPQTKVRKMEEELYNLIVKENDLKTYVRIFQELAVLCLNMVPNTKKLLETFIGVPIESLSPQVVSAAKLPILNPNEFNLWKMIKQYFLMTDYSLWERLARKNELKARGTLLMALLDKHLLKFNIHKDAKTLMERKKSLDDLLNGLKIYEAEVKSSSSTSTSTQNIAFVSTSNTYNTNEPVSVAASVSVRTRRNLRANGLTFIGFDMYKVECYNCHRKGHFARECRSFKDTRRNGTADPQRRNVPVETSTSNELVSQCDGVGSYDWSFQAEDEPANYAFMAFTSLSSSSNNEVRDNALVVFRQNLKKVEQERDDLKLNLPPSPIYDMYQSGDVYHVVPPPYTGTFMPPKPDLVFHNAPDINETVHTGFNVDLSPTKPDNNFSYTHKPSAPIIEDWVSDLEDEFETKTLQNVPSFVQPTEQQYARMPLLNPQRHVVSIAVITKSKLVPINAARLVIAAVPKPPMTRPRPAKPIITKPHSPPRRYINRSPSPKASNFLLKVTGVKVPQLNGGYVAFGGNPKGGKISGKSKIRTGKLDFDDVYFVKELKFNLFSVSQMCDKKNSVLFTDTECLVLSPEFKLPDENQVLLRVPRENNMYNAGHINFKTINKLVKGNIVRGLPTKNFENDYTCVACKKGKQHRASCKTKPVSSVSQPLQRFTWVFFLATKDETSPVLKTFITGIENQLSLKAEAVNTACYVQNRVLVTKPQNQTPYELLHGRTPSIGFMRPFGCLVTILNTLDSLGKFDGKVNEGFLVGYSVGEFEDFSDNSINEVNAANSLVPVVGQISTNNTNTFSIAELEDITYSDDEEDVGTEANFYQFGNNYNRGATSIQDAEGHTQEEGIDYEKVFAPVARIEATRLFLAYASFMGFMEYQMEVKSSFLYGTIEEEVYVCQPFGFEDPDYPDKVYKVVKALYGIHQAPRAWYETLANYLLDNGFQRGKIDHTLFNKQQKGDILLVQIYVDDIIFGSTNKDLCKAFEKLMKDKFQMSSMGELAFFLDGKSASTHIDTEKPLLKDTDAEDVDVHTYRSMISSLMYLTSSRPDIMFVVCACARFQVTPKALHLHAVKRIFRYLKGKPHIGLWYPKDSPFNLVAYSHSDYAGASLDRKSTSGGCQFLICRLISWQCKKQIVVATSSTETEYVAAAS
nr:putative ribonuclease H-like domain-containing protein [Tanacetum cinerariifolium]